MVRQPLEADRALPPAAGERAVGRPVPARIHLFLSYRRRDDEAEKGGHLLNTISAHGAAIPAIGLGTWELRGAECTRAVVDAIAAGYRHVDTAASYGNEEAVGAGIKASG